ncbi:MAG: glycosyltransferase family 39 protein, partial [Chloroflexi bacterium]|nr:glycosyltransferase family 39 protein [Chloroflexota bacterium]
MTKSRLVRKDGPNLEIGLYLGLILVALALRLYHLGMEPLSLGESQRAYGAWQLLHGVAPVSWREPLPALGATAAIFLFGDSDLTVRLGAAFAGVGLVASVWLLRPLIGRWGSLAFGLLIALSPSFIFFSRQVSPAAFATLLSLLLVVFIFRYRFQPRPSFLYAAAIIWALLLNSGPMGITTTAAIVLFAAAAYAFGGGSSFRRTILGHDEPAPLLPAAFLFVAVFLLVGAGLLINLRGLGFPALRDWAIQFNLAPSARPWYYHGSLGLVYEPLVIFLAIMETMRLFSKRKDSGMQPFLAFLLLWTLVSFVLLLFTQQKQPEQLASFILPVTLLAGIYLSTKLRALDLYPLIAQGPAVAYLAVLLVVTVLAIGRYGAAIQTMPAYLWLGLIVAWLVAPLLGFHIPGLFWTKSAGGGLLVLLVVGLLFTVHTSWNANYR